MKTGGDRLNPGAAGAVDWVTVLNLLRQGTGVSLPPVGSAAAKSILFQLGLALRGDYMRWNWRAARALLLFGCRVTHPVALISRS